MNRKVKVIIGILTFLLVGVIAWYLFDLRWHRVTYLMGTDEEIAEEEYRASCNVLGINIHGDIYTYIPFGVEDGLDVVSGEDIYYYLEQAEDVSQYPNVKAVVLDIDSYGGLPVAGEEIANKIKEMDLPVISAIRGGGASAAYWIASASDRIFASRFSDVGSIGVTMSYLDESDLNQKEGFTWNSISSGKFKDLGNPEKPLTKEEKELLQRDVDIIHEEFIKDVAKNRGLSVDKVRELADGSTMLGINALSAGLVDEIGYISKIEEYLKKTYNIEPEFCWEI